MAELAKPNSPVGFAPAAVDQYFAVTDQLDADIAVGAIDRARNRRATVIDVTDVNASHRRAVGRDAQLQAWWLGVAGVLLGSALATAVAVWLSSEGGVVAAVWYGGAALAAVCAIVLFVCTYPRRER